MGFNELFWVSVPQPPCVRKRVMAEKVKYLRNSLRRDFPGCDLQWKVFLAAMNSYRADTCLRPYPPMFIGDNEFKDQARLMKAAKDVEPLVTFSKRLDNHLHWSDDIVNLVYWVLVTNRTPYINVLKGKNYLPDRSFHPKPSFVAQVVYNPEQEIEWRVRCGVQKVIFAYHGSRLDNFHSIIKFGLQQHLCKDDTLFGSGIYLSTELGLVLPYSTSHGAIDLSLVALCEVIDDKKAVKCHDSDDKTRSTNRGSIGGQIPDKYLLVQNSEYVRVRYLLGYTRDTLPIQVHPWRRYFDMKLLFVCVGLYVCLLMAITFYNGPYYGRWKRFLLSLYK